jgi:heavy metal translocating P-type ATPase
MYLSELHRLVEEITRSRSPSQEFADRVARIFTPAVILLAAGTLLVWWVRADFGSGLLAGLSVLLIACPCGLGIGATLAASIGYAQAAHRGIIVRSFASLERLGKVRKVFIDKTGTLTEGKPRLERFEPVPGLGRPTQEILSLVASVESRSEHPTALAIVHYARKHSLPFLKVRDFKNIPGQGVSGTVDIPSAQPVSVRIVGEAEHSTGIYVGKRNATSDMSASYVYINDVFSGITFVGDSMRSSAPRAVAELQDLGLSVAVLSGDSRAVTRRLAEQAGIVESRGELSPTEKILAINEAKDPGAAVCMVGDGINDAAALAAADIGVTLGSGTSFAKSSSAITILDGDLTKLPWIVRYGGRIARTIRWNFVWVFVYNVIGIGLAMAGEIRPVFAAFAMVLSSLLVIANSGRLAKINESKWMKRMPRRDC